MSMEISRILPEEVASDLVSGDTKQGVRLGNRKESRKGRQHI